MTQLKLYVWEDVLADYTSGLICILAESEEQAFELLYNKDPIAWSNIQGFWEELQWENEDIKRLSKIYPQFDLCQLQKTYSQENNIKLNGTRKKPNIITKPEAFVVHGGG